MRKYTDGILSFQDSSKVVGQRNAKDGPKDKDKTEAQQSDSILKARLSRRGAGLAFDQLSAKFGPRLLTVIPNMWQSMVGGLLSAFQSGLCPFFPKEIYMLTRL